ncbi:growth hormone receptor a [Alosa sapidissima]|uniref:growth hormone receptor a n=1 Tax=Alosa sapidissima TaxID=34773 RepID=UPI001C0A175A|nr:growth hormone receptor a [Alosa sapidissima]
MDAPSVMLLLLLSLLRLGPSAAAPSWGRTLTSDSPTKASKHGPHITDCLSREQETFKCWWSAGSFQNLTEPGALRLFYAMPKQSSKEPEWRECPQYSSTRPNECLFPKNYTHIWVAYYVELRSVEQNITYDQIHFTVETIVKPDAPVHLNWTLLNVSRSGLHFDIMVHWEPPPSAAIDVGWMTLVYQVQYRQVNASHWETLDQESGTHQTIYALQTDKTYEVRVRCKMRTYAFGEYSDTITVHVDEIPSKDASFPMTLVMVFGVVGMVILLMLIVFTQQQRLMVILLPPVPAPKIKGLDSDLLKKGKLDDLNSIMSSQHMYKFYDEPWVEFIELDVDEPNDKASNSDTQHLLGGHAGHGGCLGSSHTLSLKDDDSGRASCYDPELPMDAEAVLMAALLPRTDPTKAREGSCGGGDDPVQVMTSSGSPTPGVTSGPGTPAMGSLAGSQQTHQQSQVSCGPNWATMDFYAQVSDVTPAGGVVLSPGSLLTQSTTSEKEEEKKNSQDEKANEKGQAGERIEEGKEKTMTKKRKDEEDVLKFQLLVVNPEGGYATECVAWQVSGEAPPGMTPGSYTVTPHPPPPPAPLDKEPAGGPQRDPTTCPASPSTPGDYQSPYLLPDTNPAVLTMAPLSDYTVVQDVDSQHSLLLNASEPQPAPNSGKHLPAMPVMPMGYLSPDLLGNLMP